MKAHASYGPNLAMPRLLPPPSTTGEGTFSFKTTDDYDAVDLTEPG